MKSINKKIAVIFIIACLLIINDLPYISVKAEETVVPSIVSTVFNTQEVVVADVVAKAPAYKVDPTGSSDSSDGIIKALDACFAAGGGTVFLPKGKYRVTKNISIPPFTTLRGDYNDPDSSNFNGDYGTVILADVAASDQNFPSLFTVGGSAGAVGLTIYYPKQTTKNIKPYPYTFEIPSFASKRGHADHMAPTIRNVTMINAYKGICASITSKGGLISAANEMIHLENIKGTVLMKGAELYNSSEYGVVRNITFNNNYWANTASYFNPPSKESIDAFTKKYGMGMQLGDLEWVQFSNINLADYKIGIRLFDGLRRHIQGQPEIYFIGQFYKLNVTNTTTALRIDNMFPNFGITIADSFLQGSLFAIRNEDKTNSLVKLTGTTLKGDTNGVRIQYSGGNDTYASMKAAKTLPDSTVPSEPKLPNRLYNAVTKYGADKAGKTDSSQAIQNALNAAKSDGGGIVYLPSGYYKVTKALTVYANTELRGSAGVATRDEISMSKGTLLFANYGYTNSEDAARNSTALITLAGDNAGVRGLRVIYPDNEPDTSSGTTRLHSFTIRGTANNNYVMNASIAGAAYGIQFKGASTLQNPLIRNVSGTYYRQGLSFINTRNGHIEEALSNATVVARNGLPNAFPDLFSDTWPSDANGGLTKLYDLITRPNSHFIVADSSQNLTIAHCFTFGSKKVVTSTNSSIKILNSAGDNLYPSGGALFDITGGSLTGVNLMRYSGTALINNGCSVNLFNRISLMENTDKDVVNSKEVAASAVDGSEKSVNDLPETYVYNSSLDPVYTKNSSGNNGKSGNNKNSVVNGNQSGIFGTDGSTQDSQNGSTQDSQNGSTQDSQNGGSADGSSSGGSNSGKTGKSFILPIIIIASVLFILGAGAVVYFVFGKKLHIRK